jgi:hypothetical protein
MLTFVAPAYLETHEPYVFIGSLLCQLNPNWKAIIYHNGPNPALQAIVESFGDKRLMYKESEANTGAWGTYNRIDAIKNLVDTPFIIQTSIQDYWLPNAVDSISIHTDQDFIYWNSINHLSGYANILDCRPVVDHIDWGNFAIRTAIAQKVGINHPTEFTADGLFVKDCMESGLAKSMIKLEKVLTIHN